MTSKLVENTKANEITIIKELGKLIPKLREKVGSLVLVNTSKKEEA